MLVLLKREVLKIECVDIFVLSLDKCVGMPFYTPLLLF